MRKKIQPCFLLNNIIADSLKTQQRQCSKKEITEKVQEKEKVQ